MFPLDQDQIMYYLGPDSVVGNAYAIMTLLATHGSQLQCFIVKTQQSNKP